MIAGKPHLWRIGFKLLSRSSQCMEEIGPRKYLNKKTADLFTCNLTRFAHVFGRRNVFEKSHMIHGDRKLSQRHFKCLPCLVGWCFCSKIERRFYLCQFLVAHCSYLGWRIVKM